jgi:hypothetical protein
MRAVVMIALEDLSGKTVSLGTILDPDVLRVVAKAAIREKRARVEHLEGRDKTLGFVAREELHHLERVLIGLVPDLQSDHNATARLQ